MPPILLFTAQFERTLSYQIKALKIAQDTGDQVGEAKALNGIAIVYVWLHDHEKALVYFRQSLQVCEEAAYEDGKAVALMNLCMSYRDVEQYDASLEYGFRCLAMSRQLVNQSHEAEALKNIGNTYMALGQHQEALTHFHSALTLIESVENKYVQVTVLLHLGKAYCRLQQFQPAHDSLSQALAIAEESEQKGFQFECHQELAALYKAEGKFERALTHYEQFHAIKEAVFNEETERRLHNLELQHRMITAEKEAQIYQLKNVTLEQEIAERQLMEAEREQLIAELGAKNVELERFTYTVSHDLRSPLITIKGFLAFLAQDILAGNVERAQADMKYLHDAVERMQQLLEDLLHLSRMGQMVNQKQRLAFGDLAHEAVLAVAGRIQEGGVQVDVLPALPPIYGDRGRLLQVMQNLVENAVKYMGEQERPFIEIGVRQTADETVYYVKDNGIGIEPKYQARVFDLFEQLQPQAEGTGIGLALAQRIIESHGGRIWVESEGLGRGSVFCFVVAAEGG
ncbi:MAG: tetratricopeptide repeat protein [Ardenticatenaceae bacterium]|nr:tetratricopeptide repeat protein [Ardenticatenaceae bacterium]